MSSLHSEPSYQPFDASRDFQIQNPMGCQGSQREAGTVMRFNCQCGFNHDPRMSNTPAQWAEAHLLPAPDWVGVGPVPDLLSIGADDLVGERHGIGGAWFRGLDVEWAVTFALCPDDGPCFVLVTRTALDKKWGRL